MPGIVRMKKHIPWRTAEYAEYSEQSEEQSTKHVRGIRASARRFFKIWHSSCVQPKIISSILKWYQTTR